MNEKTIKKTKTKELVFLALYTFLFFTIWALFELTLKEKIGLINPYLKLLIKFLIWTLPVCLIIKYRDRTNFLNYLKLKENFVQGLVWGLGLGVVMSGYVLLSQMIFLKKTFYPMLDWYTLLSAVVLIGFTEEVVFRGFLLQKLNESMGFWTANLLSSGLFLLIHFPKWYHEGLFLQTAIYGSLIFVFCFGMLEGYVLKRTQSLWACMLIHSANNLMVLLFK